MRDDATALETLDMTPGGRATRFLNDNLQYPRSSFDAVLLWDLLDYLEPTLAKQMVAELDRVLAARRRGLRHVPQQEAGRISALPRGGFEHAADDFDGGHLPGAKGLSKPRDPGPLWPLPHDEIVREPRSASRNTLHQVNKSQVLHVARHLWISCVHQLFACVRQIRGVKARRELTELRRDYDSTGLRAAPKLNTPLLRCASLVKHTCY